MFHSATAASETRSETAQERRNVRRNRVLKGGRIRFNQGYSAFECTVRNLNEHGAMIVLGETTGLPHDFELEINGETGHRAAHVMWRDATRCGLVFN